MTKWASLCSLFFCLVGVNIQAADEAAVEDSKNKNTVVSRFSEDSMSTGSRRLFVYSKVALKNVEYKFEKVTDGWTSLQSLKPIDGYQGVFVSPSYLQTDEGRVYLVRGILPDGQRFTDKLTVEKGNGEPEIETVFGSLESKETVAKEVVKETPKKFESAAGAQTSAEGQFMALLNNYRRQNGRQPVAWCPSCASASAINNQGRGAHNHMGAGRAQNWAGTSSPSGAFNMWRNSSGHNANMLGGYRYAGISFRNGEATLTLR